MVAVQSLLILVFRVSLHGVRLHLEALNSRAPETMCLTHTAKPTSAADVFSFGRLFASLTVVQRADVAIEVQLCLASLSKLKKSLFKRTRS